jgi:hypothetical protein
MQDSVSTLDQGSSPESYGVSAATNHVFDLYLQTMICSPNSPFLLQREAGRSIKKTIGFRLPPLRFAETACENHIL